MPDTMDTGRFAAEQVRTLLQRLAYQVGNTMKSRSPEAIQDLRTAVRRLAQALAVFKDCFPNRELKKIRRRLKHTMALTGAVRDCDIALQLLAESKAPGRAGLQQKLRARRREWERALQASLKLWVDRKSSSKWRHALDIGLVPEELRRQAVAETASREVARIARRFFRCGNDAAASKASAGDLHRSHIALKKLRCTLELLGSVYSPAVSGPLEQIGSVQALLCASDHCRTAREIISGLGGHRKVEAALKRRQRKAAQEFRRVWEERFAQPGVAKEWLAALRRPEQTPPARKPMARAAAAGSAVALEA